VRSRDHSVGGSRGSLTMQTTTPPTTMTARAPICFRRRIFFCSAKTPPRHVLASPARGLSAKITRYLPKGRLIIPSDSDGRINASPGCEAQSFNPSRAGLGSGKPRPHLGVVLGVQTLPPPQKKNKVFITPRANLSGAVYCYRSCLRACLQRAGRRVFVCVCLWVCNHDNSKLRASILTKLGLWVKVVTVSSWLNYGRPAPPGRRLRRGEIF